MDRVKLSNRPLHIRSGHTPVNIGLIVGSLVAAVPGLLIAPARSGVVNRVLPTWAMVVFYVLLLIGAALALSAVWRQLPDTLDEDTYPTIVGRLVRERIGLYGVAGTMLLFAFAVLAASGWRGLQAAAWLIGPAVGFIFRARQTHQDVHKLHRARDSGQTVDGHLVADPDGPT